MPIYIHLDIQGHVQDFWKGGSNISWFPKKRSSDFKRGCPMVWRGVQYICLTRTTNLAYLDAKEWTNMYFEPLISVKCCPKLHIKQLRNNLHYICLWDRLGLGGITDEKGGSRKRGGSGPPDPPLLYTPMDIWPNNWGRGRGMVKIVSLSVMSKPDYCSPVSFANTVL